MKNIQIQINLEYPLEQVLFLAVENGFNAMKESLDEDGSPVLDETGHPTFIPKTQEELATELLDFSKVFISSLLTEKIKKPFADKITNEINAIAEQKIADLDSLVGEGMTIETNIV